MANPKKLPKWAIKQAGGINKKAWALARRGRGKASSKPRKVAKKPARKRSKSVAKKSNPGNKRPKIGAAIQAFKGAQPLISPVFHGVVQGRTTEAATKHIRFAANASYAGNVAMSAVNQVVDRKIAQGGALSRGSVTAWAAEAFAALKASEQSKGVKTAREAAVLANIKLARTLNGYDPATGSLDFTDPDFRTYHGIKIGGGFLRRASNTGPLKKVFAPVKKLLGEMGGAL